MSKRRIEQFESAAEAMKSYTVFIVFLLGSQLLSPICGVDEKIQRMDQTLDEFESALKNPQNVEYLMEKLKVVLNLYAAFAGTENVELSVLNEVQRIRLYYTNRDIDTALQKIKSVRGANSASIVHLIEGRRDASGAISVISAVVKPKASNFQRDLRLKMFHLKHLMIPLEHQFSAEYIECIKQWMQISYLVEENPNFRLRPEVEIELYDYQKRLENFYAVSMKAFEEMGVNHVNLAPSDEEPQMLPISEIPMPRWNRANVLEEARSRFYSIVVRMKALIKKLFDARETVIPLDDFQTLVETLKLLFGTNIVRATAYINFDAFRILEIDRILKETTAERSLQVVYPDLYQHLKNALEEFPKN